MPITWFTNTRVNLRLEPGLNGSIIQTLEKGELLYQLEQGRIVDGLMWLKVKVGNIIGFIATHDKANNVLIIQNKLGHIISELSEKYEIQENYIKAVIKVESGQVGFRNGRLLIRFEAHIFLNRVPESGSHFRFGNPIWTNHSVLLDGQWFEYHGNQELEYRALATAIRFNESQAYESASYGLPQLMGFNYRRAGYRSAKDMYNAFVTGEEEQLRAMFRWMDSGGLITHLKNKDLYSFARAYNGSGQARYYADLIAQNL